jgi:predicted amidophosphoribosyltransferase
MSELEERNLEEVLEDEQNRNTICKYCGASLSPEESAYCEECAQWQ